MTGASRGIGRTIALRTGRAGVCLSDIEGPTTTLWLDLGPDWDEEKVAEFLAMCASTWWACYPGDRDPGGRAAMRPSS